MYYVTELFFFSRHLHEAQAALFVVQLLHLVRLFVIPWAAAHQASLPFTVSWSLLKLMSIESMIASNHLILCRPLLLLPSIFSNIRVFSSQSALHIRWPKYWSFSINPSNEYQCWFPLELTESPRDFQESSTPQFESINSAALSLLYGPTLISIHDCWKNHS